jgi:hypothetical protein
MPTDIGLLSFDAATDVWLLPNGERKEIPLALQGNYCGPNTTPLHCDRSEIRLLSSLTNLGAAMTLYHETQHYFGYDEIEARIRTERFATLMGWPETSFSYRTPNGSVNEWYITNEVTNSPHYNPDPTWQYVRRDYLGEHEVQVLNWDPITFE